MARGSQDKQDVSLIRTGHVQNTGMDPYDFSRLGSTRRLNLLKTLPKYMSAVFRVGYFCLLQVWQHGSVAYLLRKDSCKLSERWSRPLHKRDVITSRNTANTHTHTQRIQISTYTRSEHEGNSELSIHVLAVSRSCRNPP